MRYLDLTEDILMFYYIEQLSYTIGVE